MQPDRAQQVTRRVAVCVLAAVALLVVASATVTLLPGGSAPMPPVIWLQGAESTMDRGAEDRAVRVGAADGPDIGEVHQVSAFERRDPSSGARLDGISLRRPSTAIERRQYDLARRALIPLHRRYVAGYRATGETIEIDGEVWREFRLFDPRFETLQIGWWPR